MAPAQFDSALHGLKAELELAGAAMACRYSSSAEYEAALIAERRRAGVYDLPKRHRPVLWSALAAGVVIALLLAS
jgi:hypothetical protein